MSSSNSTYSVTPRTYPESLKVPTSKSYANRLLVLAALSPDEVTVSNLSASTDVLSMIDALKRIGLKIEGSIESGEVKITNSFPACEENIETPLSLHTGDGGTTNRFLLALLALGARTYRLVTSGRMKERPSAEFFETFQKLGVSIVEGEGFWCEVKGPVKQFPKELEVDCSRSTQFATALALSLCLKGVKVIPLEMNTSKAYWEMTETLIESFCKGVRVFRVPVDFSSLTYPLALGVDAGAIRVSNCFEIDAYQADSEFIKMLKLAGVQIHFDQHGLKLQRLQKELRPLDVSIASCPDLTPTLAFLCSLLTGKSMIRDVDVLLHKESDRAFWIEKVLLKVGVHCHYDRENSLIEISGPWERPAEALSLELPDDHRIIMMGYLFLNAAAGGTLDHATHVEKSFPNFFQIMSGK